MKSKKAWNCELVLSHKEIIDAIEMYVNHKEFIPEGMKITHVDLYVREDDPDIEVTIEFK